MKGVKADSWLDVKVVTLREEIATRAMSVAPLRVRGGRAAVDTAVINNATREEEEERKNMTEDSELTKGARPQESEEGVGPRWRGSSWHPHCYSSRGVWGFKEIRLQRRNVAYGRAYGSD